MQIIGKNRHLALIFFVLFGATVLGVVQSRKLD